MANRVAKFEKISYKQFKKDWEDTFSWSDMMDIGLLPKEFSDPKLPDKVIKDIYDKCVFLLQFVLVIPNNVPRERIFGLVTTCTAHFL